MTWNTQKSKQHYNLDQWGKEYFDINPEGRMTVFPSAEASQSVDLHQLVQDLVSQGLRLPILIRFADILRHRVKKLNDVFQQAITSHGYQNNYLSVYPIKVNQQHYVADTIYQQDNVGLESGSKSELLAVLALAKTKKITIVCNGYKDHEYIRLALIGQQLGHEVFIIIEKLSELPMVLAQAEKMQLLPKLGIRVRLASIAKGKWQNTGGEKSKFGLVASQILQCVEMLKRQHKLECLSLLHCHLGSQISNIRDIQKGLGECAQFYSEMMALGVELTHVDVGGGLGVDYEGTNSRSMCSINYSWQEYANNVVLAFKTVCEQLGLAHPQIITESGRGLTAHHAVLVTNIIDVDNALVDAATTIDSDAPAVLQNMEGALSNLALSNAIETYHEMLYWLGEVHHMFHRGAINLQGRASAEQLYARALKQIRTILNPTIRHHREIIDSISHKLADKVFCNFSVFQSLPDVWAIQQVFPIMPLSLLDMEPVRQVVLQDLTCDSDGRIDHYVDDHGIEPVLSLPYLQDKAADKNADKNPIDCFPEYLGFFMIGAYQEILGDMHNLFGDTDSVHVELKPQGGYAVTHQYAGDKAVDVLRYVNFSEKEVLDSYESQLASTSLSDEVKKSYLESLQVGLDGYTYLENE